MCIFNNNNLHIADCAFSTSNIFNRFHCKSHNFSSLAYSELYLSKCQCHRYANFHVKFNQNQSEMVRLGLQSTWHEWPWPVPHASDGWLSSGGSSPLKTSIYINNSQYKVPNTCPQSVGNIPGSSFSVPSLCFASSNLACEDMNLVVTEGTKLWGTATLGQLPHSRDTWLLGLQRDRAAI